MLHDATIVYCSIKSVLVTLHAHTYTLTNTTTTTTCMLLHKGSKKYIYIIAQLRTISTTCLFYFLFFCCSNVIFIRILTIRILLKKKCSRCHSVVSQISNN